LWGASEELRGDRDVVLAAVKQNGRALEQASFKLQFEMAECWQDAIKKGVFN